MSYSCDRSADEAPPAAPECIQGDATREATVRLALKGELADAIVTDPPYCLLTRRRKGGDEREPKGRKVERGPLRRFETVREYRSFTARWLEVSVKMLREAAPLIVWTNFLGREPIISQAAAVGFECLRGEFVWAKPTRETSSGETLLRVVETALVFSRRPAPPVTAEAPALPWAVVAGVDDDGEAQLWGNHPHHKPFGVLEPLLRTWTRPGDLVLDPFAGSGAIGAAVLRLKRRAACIELEAQWAQRVTQRLASL